MNLHIVTPLAVIANEDVQSLCAEDASGSFGILPGHADFLTSLSVSVLRWVDVEGEPHYCAVRGGVLTVTNGKNIAIATREAVKSDDLATLDQTVLAQFRSDLETERTEHVQATRLQLNVVRQLIGRLKPRSGLSGSQ